jgi:hypothetical protein
MALANLGRSFERRLLRPVFRRLKRVFHIDGPNDRIARLEQRLEELERLFREQAGLHYLRLAEEAEPAPPGQEPARGRRTA